MSLTALYVSDDGCVPPGFFQNIDRRVVVSVQTETTRALHPSARQVEVLKHRSAVRAALRRVGRVDQAYLTTSTRSLVREILLEHAPTAVQDAFAQVVIANHVTDRQVFQRDTITRLHECGTQFVQHVTALVGSMHLLALYGSQRLTTVLASPFLASKRTLYDPQFPLRHPTVVRVLHFLPVAAHNQRRDAHVDSDVASGFGQGRTLRNFTDKTGIPLTHFVDNPNRFRRAFHRTMPANADTSDLEQFQAPAVQLCAYAELRKIETVESVSTFETWIARRFTRLYTAKKSVKRFAQINRCRLQGLTEYALCLREGLPIQACLFDLFVLKDTATFQFVAPLPIFQTHVVEVATDRKHTEHTLFLRLARIETVLERRECQLCTLLSLNILFDASSAHLASSAAKIAVRPQRRQFEKLRELLSQYSRGTSLEGAHDFVWRFFGGRLNKKVNVIRFDRQIQDRPTMFLCNLKAYFAQTIPQQHTQALVCVF